MVKNIISLWFLVAGLTMYAQENPKIDQKEFSPSSGEPAEIKKAIKQGDAFYQKGLYDAALQQYMKLYDIKDDNSPLNYKIAVSRLYGVHPKEALSYFDRINADVASDYYFLKGIALINHQRYEEAKMAFRQYSDNLPAKQAAKMTDKINRFIAICDFSEKAIQDSLPVFIINAGPKVNSYYDDYSAVELLLPAPALYFTSRRPKSNETNIASRSTFSERILYSSEFVDGEANEAQAARLKSGKHLSVAGVDNNAGALLYYKGKKRFGDVYRTQFKEKNGKTTNQKRLKKKISKKTSAEGSVSFADNGDAYFISDRFGGKGGKDIWYAAKKGKKGYHRPQNLSVLNTPLNEECVFVAPDGNTLYFSSNGLPGFGGFDIFKSVRMSDGTWGEPVNMGYPINGPDHDLFYRLTSDSTLALFSSKRSGGLGGLDIYYIKKDMRIPFELSGNVTDIRTGKTLEATVVLIDKTTGMPVATVVNDAFRQRYVLNMDDTGDFYLQAEAPGYRPLTEDLIMPVARNAKVQHDLALERLSYTISGYVFDAKTAKPVPADILIKLPGKDDVMYSAKSDPNSGFYSLTIENRENVNLLVKAKDYFEYGENLLLDNTTDESGTLNINLQRSGGFMLTGVVTSEGDSALLRAHIIATKAGVVQPAIAAVTGENGKYELVFPDVGPYLLEVTSEGHFFANHVMRFVSDSAFVVRNFTLKKMESGAKIVIENILFNTGNATLLPASFTELNKLVKLLKENPNVRIEVSGHTDNVGSAATNKRLSKNRALSVKNYLVSQGIAADRVEYEGYGFDRPIAPNTTAEGRAANRRVEIEVLK